MTRLFICTSPDELETVKKVSGGDKEERSSVDVQT